MNESDQILISDSLKEEIRIRKEAQRHYLKNVRPEPIVLALSQAMRLKNEREKWINNRSLELLYVGDIENKLIEAHLAGEDNKVNELKQKLDNFTLKEAREVGRQLQKLQTVKERYNERD